MSISPINAILTCFYFIMGIYHIQCTVHRILYVICIYLQNIVYTTYIGHTIYLIIYYIQCIIHIISNILYLSYIQCICFFISQYICIYWVYIIFSILYTVYIYILYICIYNISIYQYVSIYLYI